MRIVRPGDFDYDSARQGINRRFNQQPAAIFFCDSEQDVGQAVKRAISGGKSLRVRSGRHSYEGYSLGDPDSCVIDVSALKGIEPVKGRSQAWIGAGALMYEGIYQPLYNDYGKTIPAGSCPTVGMAGLATGGGFSFSGRYLGLTCDNIQGIRIVTADGQLQTIDSDHQPDLFWACCGAGGGSFGAITAFLMRLAPAEDVAIYKLTWDWDQDRVATITRQWFELVAESPRELTCFLRFTAAANGNVLSSFGQFYGSQSCLQFMVQQAFLGVEPCTIEFRTLSSLEAVEHWGGLDGKNQPVHMKYNPVHGLSDTSCFKASSALLKRALTDGETHRLFLAFQGELNGSFVVFDAHQNGCSSIMPDDYNAYAHRKAIGSAQVYSAWKDPASEASRIRWVETVRSVFSEASMGAYCNYCDSNLVNSGQAYYGDDHYAKLKIIKAAYDPDNRFCYPQSIPPA